MHDYLVKRHPHFPACSRHARHQENRPGTSKNERGSSSKFSASGQQLLLGASQSLGSRGGLDQIYNHGLQFHLPLPTEIKFAVSKLAARMQECALAQKMLNAFRLRGDHTVTAIATAITAALATRIGSGIL